MRSLRFRRRGCHAQLVPRPPRGWWDCITPDFAKQKAARFMPTGRRPPPRQDGPSLPRSHSDPRLREQPPLGASFLNITRGPPCPMICECEIFLPRRGRVPEAAEPNALLPHQAIPRNFPARPDAQGRGGDKGPGTPGCQDRKVPGGRLAFPGRTGPPPTQWKRPKPSSQRNLSLPPFSPCRLRLRPRAQGWHVVMRLAPGKPRVSGGGWVLCREAAPRCRRP